MQQVQGHVHIQTITIIISVRVGDGEDDCTAVTMTLMLLGGEGELEIKYGLGVKNPAFVVGADVDILSGEDEGEKDLIFTPMGDVDEEGGGGGVKNKGSVDKLLKLKLSLLVDNNVVGVVIVAVENCGIPVALATIVGSDIVDLLVPVVVVVEVLLHIEDNTKAAATVCS
ncbi:hypothetical protein FF38_12604 [Lucilia cuprina]|uniref:Uncharacterized protein n=1 Tax=Lucilia cuprina TaxID=7375 RepID=A0A0L0BQG4_LUCCU|nr:hypothetical protein FF38_12604 [Lucilia cuprina]